MKQLLSETPPQSGSRNRLAPGGGSGWSSPADRAARGKQARNVAPREDHAIFEPPDDRPDPIGLLESQAASRVAELVPIRYGRMMISPFTYFRGAALPMASDLSATPVSGLTAQVCGDAHLANFGLFGSAERNLVFDVNDFDETLPGPWEWDVKRLAASLEVAARANGFGAKARRKILIRSVERYRLAMRVFADLSNLDVWYARADMGQVRAQFESQLKNRQRKTMDANLAKAKTRDSTRDVERLTTLVNGRAQINSVPPLVVPLDELIPEHADRAPIEAELTGMMTGYRHTLESDRRVMLEQFQTLDMARKVVGVGSVGTRCWIVLLRGRDDSDLLFLQIKEAQDSVLSPYVGASAYRNQGHRVVAGQRLMQASSDIFLGWQHIDSGLDGRSRDFYVRQLRDWKLSADVDAMNPRGLRLYGELCAWTLARAHARSGDRIAIAAYLGGSALFEHSVAQFADAYADQNERDHAALCQAVASGRIVAEDL